MLYLRCCGGQEPATGVRPWRRLGVEGVHPGGPRPCEGAGVVKVEGECDVSLSVEVCVGETSLCRCGNSSEMKWAACYKDNLGGGD